MRLDGGCGENRRPSRLTGKDNGPRDGFPAAATFLAAGQPFALYDAHQLQVASMHDMPPAQSALMRQ
ncbi:MAG TPA: hypothetical protein VFH73_26495, partial [Polyangia bacterium]|nr:hypothetical protein [Polyangia bacterium]